ncbi:MAG: hypothetical protein U0929_12685 [Planctomycetaceae bacterium]
MAHRRFFLATILCLTWTVVAWSSDDAELPEYFDGLRAQGLFRIAEEYAVARLAETDVTGVQRAILSIELSRVLASHAAEASSENQAKELWSRAEEVLTPLLKETENPRWRAVRARQATLLCDHALAGFWICQLDPDSEVKREASLAVTLSAIESLKSAMAEIEEASKAARTRTGSVERRAKPTPGAAERKPDSAMSSAEVRRVGDELEYFLLRMMVNKGRLLPSGPDRVAALVDADQLSETLVKHVNNEFIWPIRLARAETMRWLGDPGRSIAYLKSLRAADLDPEVVDAIVAEQARAILADQKPAEAMQLILKQGDSKPAPNQGLLTAEQRSILVECLLASIPVTRGKGDAAIEDDLARQATAQQELISGPWRAYVDALLARSIESRQYGDQLATIVREGRLASQRRDWPAAADAYARAAQQANADGKVEQAAEFAYAQAAVEIEAGQFEQASRLLREFPTQFPQDSRVVEAHVLLAWTLGRLNADQPSEARRADYISQLKEHVAKFPDSPTIHEAQWSLAVDAIQHQEWAAAADALEAIPSDHARAIEVEAQLPYCYKQGLAAITEAGARTAWEERALAALKKQYAHWPRPPAGWNLAQSENALRWTRLLLRLGQRRYREADQLLMQIVNSREIEAREVARDGSKLDPAWDRLMPAATQLRVISLAGMGKMSDAEKLFESATASSPNELLPLLAGLSEMASGLDEPTRRHLGRIQLSAARKLAQQRASLAPEVAGLVDRCLADAYVATGDLPEAIGLYESLLKANPRDRALLETIGSLSMQRGQPDDLKRAKGVYRQLEGLSPPGSPAWLLHRLTVARVCYQLGENAEGAKLLKVTRILYPELGGPALKAEYAALETQLRAKP